MGAFFSSEPYAVGRARLIAGPDGRAYRVHLAHAGPEGAAHLLAMVNARVLGLVDHLRLQYGGAGPSPRRKAARRLLARYDPARLMENSPLDPAGETSYVQGAGRRMALCLRDRAPGHPLHDPDLVTFVALHEAAHLAAGENSHPRHFWSTFRFLLEEAERAGVYESPPFARAPRQYCGLLVAYNPRFDPNVSPLAN